MKMTHAGRGGPARCGAGCPCHMRGGGAATPWVSGNVRTCDPRSRARSTLHPVPPTMTARQTAQLLGIGLRQTYEAIQRGDIPALRLGRRWVIPSSRLLELIGLDPAVHIGGQPEDTAGDRRDEP
jgi:excisionase family DNA binding protein